MVFGAELYVSMAPRLLVAGYVLLFRFCLNSESFPDFSLSFQNKCLSLPALRITGNVRTTRERKAKGEAFRFVFSAPLTDLFLAGPNIFIRGRAILMLIMLILEAEKTPLVRHHLLLMDMKRKYCLIRNDGDLNPSSFVYVVWAGSSLRESCYLALVEEFCKDSGWYFKRWCPEVDSALRLRCKYGARDAGQMLSPYNMMTLSIHQCYQTILDDSWTALEQSYVMTPQETRMRFYRSIPYLQRLNGVHVLRNAHPRRRKHLSHAHSGLLQDFVAPVVLILLLLVLDAFVSSFVL